MQSLFFEKTASLRIDFLPQICIFLVALFLPGRTYQMPVIPPFCTYQKVFRKTNTAIFAIVLALNEKRFVEKSTLRIPEIFGKSSTKTVRDASPYFLTFSQNSIKNFAITPVIARFTATKLSAIFANLQDRPNSIICQSRQNKHILDALFSKINKSTSDPLSGSHRPWLSAQNLHQWLSSLH